MFSCYVKVINVWAVMYEYYSNKNSHKKKMWCDEKYAPKASYMCVISDFPKAMGPYVN